MSRAITVTIQVPMEPPWALLPNIRRKGKGGAHWSEQTAWTAAFRMAARGAALNAKAPSLSGPVIVRYDVVWSRLRYPGKRKYPDCDAIPSACKSVLDGIVDAGILVDDGPEYVVEVQASGRRAAAGEDGVTLVTITELAPAVGVEQGGDA